MQTRKLRQWRPVVVKRVVTKTVIGTGLGKKCKKNMKFYFTFWKLFKLLNETQWLTCLKLQSLLWCTCKSARKRISHPRRAVVLLLKLKNEPWTFRSNAVMAALFWLLCYFHHQTLYETFLYKCGQLLEWSISHAPSTSERPWSLLLFYFESSLVLSFHKLCFSLLFFGVFAVYVAVHRNEERTVFPLPVKGTTDCRKCH